ncbi:MAG: HlyD family efflux transporter periplasmic adaptor subunit [Planctomycetota bacterium]
MSKTHGVPQAAGWQQIIAGLSAAAERDEAFADALLAALARVTGARQAALLVAAGAEDPAGPTALDREQARPSASDAGAGIRAVRLWPEAGGGEPDASLAEPDAMRSSAASVLVSGQPATFPLSASRSDGLYEAARGEAMVLAVPVGRTEDASGRPGRPMSAAVMVLDHRSASAMQTTTALAELIAGYAQLASARQQLARTRSSASALDLATRLIASTNTAESFKGAAMQLVNDICRQLGADRVALGWRVGRGGAAAGARGGAESVVSERDSVPVRVMAISDTEHVDRRMAMVRKLAAAMDECVDQQQPVVFPIPEPPAGTEPDPVLTRAVVHAHRELAASDANLKLASLPIRDGDETLGVLTIESAKPGQSIEVRMIEVLLATLDLVGPVLRLRRSDDRAVPLRAIDSSRKAAAWLVGPTHTLWKAAGAAVLLLMVALVVVDRPYRIEAPVSLAPVDRRVIAAPYDATIVEVLAAAEPGRRVEAGELLMRLDTSEMELSAIEARGQLRQAEAQSDDAMRRGNGAEQQQAGARADQARARLKLFQRRIEQAEVRAPISGTVLTGDLRDRIGGTLTRGDVLFEIAPLDSMRVVASVDDRDIGLVLEAMEAEGAAAIGTVATRAYPDRRYPVVIERVVPMAQAEGGQNAFEVHATLDDAAAWMRPGMQGLAKLEVGDRSLLWIGSRRIVDTLRLWLWW